jgi:SH3-like domain-containing protein
MRTRTARLYLPGLLLVLGVATLSARQLDARAPRFVRVKVDVANLRAQPSGTAELVRHAYENEPLRVIGARGPWIQVRDVADESAWIHGKLIDGRPAVVVVRDLVNVREQPGTEHPVIFTAERGVNLLVLERSDRWLHVRHEVGEGWIHDSLVWGPP